MQDVGYSDFRALGLERALDCSKAAAQGNRLHKGLYRDQGLGSGQRPHG